MEPPPDVLPEATPPPAPVIHELAPMPPGPGLPMALVWVLAFFGMQIAVIMGLFLVLIGIKVLESGQPGIRDATELLKDPPLLLISGTGAVLVSVLAITGLVLRGKFRRALALRPCT